MRPTGHGVSRVLMVSVALGWAVFCCAARSHAQSDAAAAAAPKNTTQKFPYPGEAAAPDAPGAPANEVKRPPGYENETPFQPDAPAVPSAAKTPAGAKTPPPYPRDPEAPQAAVPQAAVPQAAAPQAAVPPAAGRKAPPAYPGDPDAAAAAPANPVADGFSSSSVPGTSDDAGPLSDVGSSGDEPEPDARKHPVRKKLPKIDPQTPAMRETEDLNVAEFYQKSGNFVGAYARAKDAVSLMPGDPFGHLALADAARKMGKADEARTEYERVLTLDPAPKEMKAAQRALAEFSQAKR